MADKVTGCPYKLLALVFGTMFGPGHILNQFRNGGVRETKHLRTRELGVDTSAEDALFEGAHPFTDLSPGTGGSGVDDRLFGVFVGFHNEADVTMVLDDFVGVDAADIWRREGCKSGR